MRVFGEDILGAFTRTHPAAEKSVKAWRQVIESNAFWHFADLKTLVRTADYVKPYTVFNISKNKYRMITQISYGIQEVRVVEIMAHEEYDSGKWRRGL